MTMVFIKWLGIFLVSFAIAFVIIVTFSQPQFRVPVSALLFTYQTKPLPIWAYVGGALGFGLIIGLSVAAYYYITLRASIFKKDRQIKNLESELESGRSISGSLAPDPDPVGDDSF
jgi:uncharacterized membrane protein YciS (DUF1049 family)